MLSNYLTSGNMYRAKSKGPKMNPYGTHMLCQTC
uniref:Uncharacterized protein n=1 Tax=Anguilla anguilla TaxID=7936 RepID=A0A0E9RHH4_ANGAN